MYKLRNPSDYKEDVLKLLEEVEKRQKEADCNLGLKYIYRTVKNDCNLILKKSSSFCFIPPDLSRRISKHRNGMRRFYFHRIINNISHKREIALLTEEEVEKLNEVIKILNSIVERNNYNSNTKSLINKYKL